MDSAAGYLKTAARQAVVRDVELNINNAKDLYDFACKNLGSNSCTERAALHRRRFFYVDKLDISQRSNANFTTIKGTQKLHSVASTGVEGKVNTRLLTCYCPGCIGGKYDDCQNKEYVEPFKLVSFTRHVATPGDADPSDSSDEEGVMINEAAMDNNVDNPMYEMIMEDSVVAVRPNIESISDYFLFHVMSDGVECLKENVGCSGHYYAAGSRVLRGYYYELVNTNRKGCLYKPRKDTDNGSLVIPVGCVIYVGIDMDPGGETGRYMLQKQDHEDIMCAI